MNLTEKNACGDSFDSNGSTKRNASSERELERIIQSPTFRMKQLESKLVAHYSNREQKIPISIIMPTWNRRFIIKRAIDSVLAQSYQNFQLIVSDDGSADDTGRFINENYGSDSRISYIYNIHRGVTYARNSALEMAKGEILAYLDSDNQWTSNYLLIMVNALRDASGKSAAYCGLRVINMIRPGRFIRLVDYNRASLLQRNYIDMNIFIHGKDLYNQYGGFDHEAAPLEDWELILRYTQGDSPLVVKCCLANYYIDKNYNHHSLSKGMDLCYEKIKDRYCI